MARGLENNWHLQIVNRYLAAKEKADAGSAPQLLFSSLKLTVPIQPRQVQQRFPHQLHRHIAAPPHRPGGMKNVDKRSKKPPSSSWLGWLISNG
jgi:hypothetical protein